MVSAMPVALFTAIAIVLAAVGIDLNRKNRFSPASTIVRQAPAVMGAAALSRGLKSLLPLVMVAFPEDVRVQTGRRLNWGGVESVTAAEFLALKLAAAACITVAGMLAGAMLGVPFMWSLLLAGIGYMLPDLWLQSRVSGRQKQIRRDMMEFATLFAVVLRAGGDMYGALQQVGRWFGGEMGREVARAAHDVATGKRRSEALMDMADRCGVDELTQLVQVILQAGRYGTPIAEAVHQHAAQVRVMRRYAAEKLANEAAVKMTLPMLLFLVGPLMVLLAYPGIQQFVKILK